MKLIDTSGFSVGDALCWIAFQLTMYGVTGTLLYKMVFA